MFHNYQDLERAKSISIKQFNKNPNASISALFRRLRKDKRFSLMGDYPIISTVLRTRHELGLRTDKTKLLYATRQSEELKGKKKLLNCLISMQ